jgi:DNA mismatch endonuclease (patch repair protein)
MDFLTPTQRSHRMSLIRSTGTRPERAMASALRSAGLRYRGHARLPGTPDFVLVGKKIAIFADGDFWHGRNFASLRHKLAPFWLSKITSNRKRDKRAGGKLRRKGWSVLRFWEKDIMRNPGRCIAKIRQKIRTMRIRDIRIGDRVEILRRDIHPLRRRRRPWYGFVKAMDGAYILVRPAWVKWTTELYPNEIRIST